MAIELLRWTKLGALTILYLYLAGAMLFLAYQTYAYTGGFDDIGTVAVVIALVALFVLILRLAIQTLRGNWTTA